MAKLTRQPNFTEAEVLRLTEEYEKEFNLLVSKFGPNVTSQKKAQAWVRITEAMNERNPSVVRTKSQLLKKWQNMCSNMKDQYRKHRKESAKTGGGPPPDQPTQLSQKVASIIGENDPTVYGIDGGMDSLVPIASPSTSLSTCSSVGDIPDKVVRIYVLRW
ncbi:uncharacterized protein LOC135502613 [Lineus longissimus]|uniref:uncharacterized protein LOC135502613 n=1 Tax=Lineus longissimus TaxID=88925 RepID=UPI00315C9B46